MKWPEKKLREYNNPLIFVSCFSFKWLLPNTKVGVKALWKLEISMQTGNYPSYVPAYPQHPWYQDKDFILILEMRRLREAQWPAVCNCMYDLLDSVLTWDPKLCSLHNPSKHTLSPNAWRNLAGWLIVTTIKFESEDQAEWLRKVANELSSWSWLIFFFQQTLPFLPPEKKCMFRKGHSVSRWEGPERL